MVIQTIMQAFSIGNKQTEKKPTDNTKAGIYDEELCKDGSCTFQVDSIRSAFRPLGLCAKIFGLFPCYDLSFVSKLENSKTKCIHILDYCYTSLLCLLMAAGVVICTIYRPSSLENTYRKKEDDKTDYYVILASIYINMFIGLMSMFIFPRSWSQLLQLLDYLANMDKLFMFDGRKQEKDFSRRVLMGGFTVNIILGVSHWAAWILPNANRGFSDYMMITMLCLAGAIALIPTSMVIFFIHAIHLRQIAFNKKLESILLPLTPCCFSCVDYSDFGKNVCTAKLKEKQGSSVGADLEKMRILYAEISGVACRLGCLFGSHLLREYFTCLSGLIIYSYYILFLRDNSFTFWFFYLGLILYIMVKLFIMAHFGQQIICEGHRSRKIVSKTSMLQLSPECRHQLHVFMTVLSCPIQITAGDYFTIDKRLLTSIISAISTYFFILIQLRLSGNA